MDWLRFAFTEYGSLCALAGVLYTIGHAAKALAPPPERSPAWRLYRQTLPYHPVLAGVLFGWCVMGDAQTGALAGLIAVWGRDLYSTWVKHKE